MATYSACVFVQSLIKEHDIYRAALVNHPDMADDIAVLLRAVEADIQQQLCSIDTQRPYGQRTREAAQCLLSNHSHTSVKRD